MIKTTTLAEEKLKRLISETEGATGVRIYNSGGWGINLAMDIAAKPKQNDITVENNGLKIFIAKDIELMIKGITIDFDEHRGFFITGLKQSGCC